MIEYIEKETARRIINSPRTKEQMLAMLEGLPPVTPKQRTSVWVGIDQEPHETWECGLCGFVIDGSGCIDPEEYRDIYKYCPNCGAKMEGVSE